MHKRARLKVQAIPDKFLKTRIHTERRGEGPFLDNLACEQ